MHPGVKVRRNAPDGVQGPENLSLERSGCKIIGFHSRNPRSWAQQVSNLRYSNPTVNESFKFEISHFYDHKFHNVGCFYNKIEKNNIMKSCLIHSVDHW